VATKNENPTKIAQQYRDPSKGMVYELRCGDASLVLRASQSADASAEWRFEAHPMHAPQLVVIGDWNRTRAEAFRAVRELWIEKGPSLGLARFDWDQVASALGTVRALD
jgi:hypothetical protein